MFSHLPGNSEVWGAVLGPVPLASLTSLLSLLGAALLWRRERSPWWFILLAPLAIYTSLLTAYRKEAGYVVMALVLDPLALWVWLTVVLKRKAATSPPPGGAPKWAFVLMVLPIVWFASCMFALTGSVNQRVAKLESIPVPAGSVVYEKDVPPLNLGFRNDGIVYRVPMPAKEVEPEVFRILQEEGWVASSHGNLVRDGDCIFVQVQSWTWSPEWSSSENTYLRIDLVPRDKC